MTYKGAGRDRRKRENPEGASEGKEQSTLPQPLVGYMGLERNSEIRLHHHNYLSPAVGTKWKQKRVKEGLAAPFYP